VEAVEKSTIAEGRKLDGERRLRAVRVEMLRKKPKGAAFAAQCGVG
jgi:hypothetical protein